MVANPRTDPVDLTVTLLTANWDEDNTGGAGSTPAIIDDRRGAKPKRRPNGIVAVYGAPRYTRTRNDTEALFKTHAKAVTIKCLAHTPEKLQQLTGEVERIYGVVRKDPDAYWDWIEDLGETPQRDYKDIQDADALWEFRAHSRPQAT